MPYAPFTGTLDAAPGGAAAPSPTYAPFHGELDEPTTLGQKAAIAAQPAVEGALKGAKELGGDVHDIVAAPIALTLGFPYAVGTAVGGLLTAARHAAEGDHLPFLQDAADSARQGQELYDRYLGPFLEPRGAVGRGINAVFGGYENVKHNIGKWIALHGGKYGPELAATFDATADTVGMPLALKTTLGVLPHLAKPLSAHLEQTARSAPQAPAAGPQDELASQLSKHFDQPAKPDAEAANVVANAPDVDSAIASAMQATNGPVPAETPVDVLEKRAAWEKHWKTVQDINKAFADRRAQIEAQKQAELDRVAQARREAGLTPEDEANAQAMAPEQGTPQTSAQPETAMSRALKEAQGRDLLARMEAWDQRRQQDALPEQGTAAVDVRQPPEHGAALGEGNTGHEGPAGEEEKTQAPGAPSEPNAALKQEQPPAAPQEGTGEAPPKLTRAALRKLQPKIENMSPQEKEQTRKWLEQSINQHEEEGAKIARYCSGL